MTTLSGRWVAFKEVPEGTGFQDMGHDFWILKTGPDQGLYFEGGERKQPRFLPGETVFIRNKEASMTDRNVETIARSICKSKGENPDGPSRSEGKTARWQDFEKVAAEAFEACFKATQAPGEPRSEYYQRILRDIPQLPQRQDATNDQLRDLRAFANRLGMYDAADFIRTVVDR